MQKSTKRKRKHLTIRTFRVYPRDEELIAMGSRLERVSASEFLRRAVRERAVKVLGGVA